MLWERVAAGPVVWGQLGCMGPTEEGDPLARDAHTGYPYARSPTRYQTVLFKQTEEGDAHTGYPYALSGCTLKKESEEGDSPTRDPHTGPPNARSPGPIRMYFLNKLKKEIVLRALFNPGSGQACARSPYQAHLHTLRNPGSGH